MISSRRRAVVTAGRAVAFVALATGVADLLSLLAPRVETWVPFAIAAAVVTLLDGPMLGLLAAVAGVTVCALLFRIPTPALIEAAAVSAGALLVAAIVRALTARKPKQLPAPPQTQLLTGEIETPPQQEQSSREVLAAIEQLRADLAGAFAELDRTRLMAAERAALLEAELTAARGEARQVANERRELEARIAGLTSQLADARQAAADAIRQRDEDARAAGEREARQVANERRELEARIAGLTSQLADAQKAAADAIRQRDDEARAAGEREARQATSERHDLEARIAGLTSQLADAQRAAADAIRQREDEARAAREREARLQESAGDVRRAAEQLREQLQGANERATGAERRAAALEEAANELRRTLEEERDRLRRERAAREEAEAAAAELQQRFDEAKTQAIDALQEASMLKERVLALETQLASVEAELVGERTSRAAEASEEMQKLLVRVGELEEGLAEAESARADLQRELDTARTERGSLERLRIAELESHLADAQRAAEVARAEQEKRVAELEERLARQDAEYGDKLQNIVNHLAMDHESDLGQALSEKEEAKAEVRSLNMRLTALQKQIEKDRATFAALQEKWSATEERHRQAAEDSAALLTKMRAAAQGEIDALRARVAELEREVMRRTPPSADTLPGVHGHGPAAARSDESGFAIVTAAAPPPRPRILVAHPDADLRAAAKESLQRIGYEVETAADGLEGLRKAIARPPDVVVADASMPKMDGRELCQLLKSQERTAAIKVVLLTRDEAERHPERELEPDDVLRKPVKFETLRTTLAQLAPVVN